MTKIQLSSMYGIKGDNKMTSVEIRAIEIIKNNIKLMLENGENYDYICHCIDETIYQTDDNCSTEYFNELCKLQDYYSSLM